MHPQVADLHGVARLEGREQAYNKIINVKITRTGASQKIKIIIIELKSYNKDGAGL